MESAAPSVAGNVVKLLGEEYQLLSGVGGEVAELRDDLDTMNALLRMQSEAEDGAVDHFVRVWMKQLRELAYDSEDCIDLYRLRIKSRPNDDVPAWLQRLLRTLSPRRRLACEIRALRARATTISERHARYGVSRDALRRSPSLLPAPVVAPAWSPAPAKDDGQQANVAVIGIEDQANTLAERLKKPRGELNAVFSVVGFGGLGKTTLAMEVCRKVEADFPFQAMVSASQAFEPTRDLKSLLNRVLQQVVKPRTDNEKGIKEEEGKLRETDRLNVDELAKKLKESLKDKRYLIVIDDVWTVRAWEAIQSKLPENNCGSRVVVTTRIETVAKACSPASVNEDYIYHIQPLNPEDSRKLFLSRAFGSTDAKCPDDLKEAMGNILRKCGGLPLAIVSIARVLAGYTSSESKGKWETICRSVGSQMESQPTLEGMSQILTLSYNHLPHELKNCMMYLSMFPEDYAIRKDRLLQRWIAEGLVPQKRGLAMLEVAESYYEELLSRNMIFSVQGRSRKNWYDRHPFDYDGKEECCQVHDMLLEVMVSKSLESNFFSLVGGQYDGMSYDRIRRLSIHEGVDRFMQSGEQEADSARKKRTASRRGSAAKEMNLEHVRSLSMFQLHGNKLLDQLGNYTLLRVLDLEDCKGVENKHVGYACLLHLLKFLSFRGTDITKVPDQINNLEHLQTLDVRGTKLGELPNTVTELEKLERLWFTGCDGVKSMWALPEGLGRMKALREVAFALLDHNKVKVAQELGKLEQLQELAIYIDNSQIPGAEDFPKELAKSLSKLHSMRSLNIGVVEVRDNNVLQFLHRLPELPRLLRHLCFRGAICRLPSWVGSLTYLAEIVLKDVNLGDDEPFGLLCKLPSLESVKMEGDYYTGEELVARSSHNFPALINLSMEFNGGMLQTCRFEEGSMPKLEKLIFFFNGGWCSIVGIEHLTSLKEAQIRGYRDNGALHSAVEELKAESGRREEEGSRQQLQVIVKYWGSLLLPDVKFSNSFLIMYVHMVSPRLLCFPSIG